MKCGECTLCCELLEIKELKKPANKICEFCVNGCSIHDTSPKECKNFDCAYYQSEKAHLDLRPDNCKVIFEKISDILFFGTQHPDYEITDVAKKQILSFVSQGFSVMLSSTKQPNPAIYLSKNHTVEMINNEVQDYLKKREL